MKIEQCLTESCLGQRRNKKKLKTSQNSMKINAQYTQTNGTLCKQWQVHSTKCYIKKVDKSHTSDLTTYMKALERKEEDSLRRNRYQETIKLRAEINKIEIKKTKQESIKQRSGSLIK